MFCPTCGDENLQGLKYCKRCGANLNDAPQKAISPLVVAIFLAVIGFITLAGFTIPIIGMSELAHQEFNKEKLMFLPFFFLVATLGIDFMLLRLLSRLLGFSKHGTHELHPLLTRQPKYVTSEQPHQHLPQLANPMPSVTEHTTRNFEPIASREQRAKETS